jgi:hypothetical protein
MGNHLAGHTTALDGAYSRPIEQPQQQRRVALRLEAGAAQRHDAEIARLAASNEWLRSVATSVVCGGASAYRVEVVLGAVAGDLLADARALSVGSPEVDS